MAPPIAVVVVVSIATTAAVAYVVKETWEPHIKPELRKARDFAGALWAKRRRRAAPVSTQSGSDDDHPSPPRSQSPPTGDERGGFETALNSAFQLPTERHPSGFRQRRNAAGGTDGDDVEMSELDRANPWIYHPPMSPAISSSLPTTSARNSMAHSDTTEHPRDPFEDIHAIASISSAPIDSSLRTPTQPAPKSGNARLGSSAGGLQLSFVPPINVTVDSTTMGTPTPTSYLRSSSPSTSTTMTSGGPSRAQTASPFIPVEHARSAISSPASAFSWVDASSPVAGTRRFMPPMHPDDFVDIHHQSDDESEHNFSIGSFDEFSRSGASGGARSPEVDADEDDEEPMSPPHHSEQGSLRGSGSRAGSRGGSMSGSEWESVGSPGSSRGSGSGKRLV